MGYLQGAALQRDFRRQQIRTKVRFMSQDINGPQSVSSTRDLGADQEGPALLPLLGVEIVRERADATRNRRLVLAAAERLFAERGVAGVTMDDIAAAAGVGKGTLYRRFVDKGGLALALLDERERELQARILSGPPPLGVGVGPTDRLAAFVAGYLTYLHRQLDLVLLSETATVGARLRTGAHAFWRAHCTYLLRSAGAPEPHLRAGLLLAGLSAEQVRHWLVEEQRDLDELARSLADAARALASAPDPA